MSMATIKNKINHGILIFLPSLRKITEVTNANGMIHNARVSLMVVATCRASSP